MGNLILFSQIRYLLLLFLFISMVNPTPFCLPNDKSALLQFRNSMSISIYDSDSYSKINSWNESTNCCSWEGVTCDKATGQVTGLDLSSASLFGSLPRNTSLFQLQGLQRLNLAGNDFNDSSIPYGFTQLVNLKDLNLSFSSFSGLVPLDISSLNKLTSLDLSKNSFQRFDSHTFDMLTRNLSKLENLFLDNVNMSQAVLTSISLPSSLKRLSLRFCDLRGQFPNEIFQLPYLEYVDLSDNSFTGSILPSLGSANLSSSLKLLDLSSCDLQGEFPSEIIRFRNLEYLDLSWNSFTGSIPASLGNLTKLTSLLLFVNHFEGQIPDVFGKLNRLTTLHFYGCNFSGQLPLSMFNLTQLTYLELSSNRLEGPLPAHVTGLQNLIEFQSTNNLLTGGIPSWLFTLPSLESLDLSNNRLTGPISPFQKPNSIRRVLLPNNEIHGEIPTSFFGLAKLTELDLSSNNLSGVIKPDMISKLKSLEILDLSSNNFGGQVDKFDMLSTMKNLTVVNLSNNKLLSLGGENGVGSTFPKLSILALSSCNLRQFPSFLRSAKSLSQLDLSNNKIQGSILKWETQGWEQLSELDLSNNLLTSIEQFPGENLATIDLHSNLLQGPLPIPPTSVRQFLISENKLAGEIPSSICNLTSLRILDLSRNHFGGIIPPCLGNFSREIYTMNLQMNNFRGKIPDFCVKYDGLVTLALRDNQLEGLLPGSLINCTSLRFLNVANNTLNGHFPHWLGALPNLQVLILRSNGFHGRLDYSMNSSSFSRLQVIDVSGNEFNGSLPTKLLRSLKALKVADHKRPSIHQSCTNLVYRHRCQWSAVDDYKNFVQVTMKRLEMEIDLEKSLTGFTLVDFSSNRLDGRIPEVLAELHALLALNLSHNSLTGPLPRSLGSMAGLESLDLSSNKLGGRIPSELTKLTFLAVLNLSHNNFVGSIPSGNQFNTFDNDSYIGNLDLCGFPMSKKCGNNEEPNPPTSKLTEDEDSAMAFWKIVMMGYGCGVVLGLSTGYIVFTTGRPWWFVKMVERDWQRSFSRLICRNGRKRN